MFDLDRTLSDRDTAFLRFARSQFKLFQAALGGVSEDEFVSALVHLDDRGALWKDSVYQEIERRFVLRSISWQELFRDFELRMGDFYVTFPKVHETLRELQRRRLKLVTGLKFSSHPEC